MLLLVFKLSQLFLSLPVIHTLPYLFMLLVGNVSMSPNVGPTWPHGQSVGTGVCLPEPFCLWTWDHCLPSDYHVPLFTHCFRSLPISAPYFFLPNRTLFGSGLLFVVLGEVLHGR